MGVVNIISLNARGMRDQLKRKALFDFYSKRCDVFCVQETHSDEESCNIWKTEWGGDAYFSHGTNNSRGVAVFIKKDAKLQVKEYNADHEGRFIYCVMEISERLVCLGNVYAPNKDSPGFFTEKFQKCHEKSDRTVIVGDFNTVLNASLDKNNVVGAYNQKATTRINNLLEELNMTDIWRSQNPGVQRYSWYHNHPRLQCSRLDYAIVLTGIAGEVHDVFYLNGLYSDHSVVFVGIDLEAKDRGPSYWKMNVTLLSDAESVASINARIHQVKCEYQNCDAVQKWEAIKKGIHSEAKRISKVKASENNVSISQLAEYITECENTVHTLSEEQLKILRDSKDELEELMSKRAQGMLFRTRARWYMEGENNSKYFFNLERSRYNAKTCVTE